MTEKSLYYPNTFRTYSAEDVKKLQGSFQIEYSLAKLGANRLWHLFNNEPFIPALGALTGNQAMQQVKAGLKAIYVSGWQIAADGNSAGEMYPDQSLYPSNSVPAVVKKINNTLLRADQIEHSENYVSTYWLAPLIADGDAGFGGVLSTFELMKSMIEAGAAGVHFEDQLSSEKKCGHLGRKVLVPMSQFIRTLISARLATDVCQTSTCIIARTDADAAQYITSDIDERDAPFMIKSNRTSEGFYQVKGGLDYCINRGLNYAPYADALWMETSTPDLGQAKEFAQAIHEKFPNKLLCYNCSPSFNWKKNLSEKQLLSFQDDLGVLGFKFQFVTLAGFHTLNHSMFQLAAEYTNSGMMAYAKLQEEEFDNQTLGYTAVKHQREIGTGLFDQIRSIVDKNTELSSMENSTEQAQFKNY